MQKIFFVIVVHKLNKDFCCRTVMVEIKKETLDDIILDAGGRPKFLGDAQLDFPILKSRLFLPLKENETDYILMKYDIENIAKQSAFFLYFNPFQKEQIPELSTMKNRILYNALMVSAPYENDIYSLKHSEKGDDFIIAKHRIISLHQNAYKFVFDLSIGQFYNATVLGRMRAQ